MTKAIRMHAHGGPEVLKWEDIPLPEPGPGEVLIEHKAIGLNYIDIYFRTGFYKVPGFPAIIGQEGAGVVTALGPGVDSLAVGDRVAYAGGLGAYASTRTIQADRLIKLPDTIEFPAAASLMLQGLTAQYLLRRTHRVEPGETILVHAAAGGVGLILCQWARHLGVTTIGVVSTEAKAELARQNGATHVIVGTDTLPADVKRLTGGAMVPVVYDSVGRDTFKVSLECLAPLGLMVTYGSSSGAVPPVEPSMLAAKGSLFLTRPSLATYIARRADFEMMCADLFETVARGAINPAVHQTLPLREAAAAHQQLEARQTTGSTVLIP